MALTADDRWAITELIALHGHLCDNGELGRLDEVFTTDVIYDVSDDGLVHARSKGIGVNADGSCGSVTYDDTVLHTERGSRIRYRKVTPRRAPLGG